jgi:hypothetical protein
MWFAVPAVVATVGLVGKLVLRHRQGQLATRALADPPGIRTVARFRLADGSTEDILLAVAAEVARGFDHALEVTDDAIRARPHPLAATTDVIRLVPQRDALATLELTRAWTGTALDDAAHAVLHRMHAALADHPAVRELAWFARQDRRFADAYRMPVLVQGAIVP